MGTDKGLLNSNGITWAKIAQEKLQDQHLPTVLSIHKEQYESYSSIFSSNDLYIDEVEVSGPLAGILTAHYRHPSHDIMVLGCDLIDMHQDVLFHLLQTFQEYSGENDFFCFSHDNFFEPMVAIFTAQGLSKISNLNLAKKLDNYSLQHLLSNGNTANLPLPQEFLPYFKNYNSVEDLL